VSHRNPSCWCGEPSLPRRSTCSDAHAEGAHRGRSRNYDRRCRCGAPALPKRATCSDACAAAVHGTRREPKPPKPPKPAKPPKQRRSCVRCEEPALPRRATCSEACRSLLVQASQMFGCRSASRRASRAKHHARRYKGRDKRRITLLLRVKQRGRCACCGSAGESLGDGRVGLVLDHCHATGKPRALLCGRCNAALGLLREDVYRIDLLRCYALACAKFRV
jgi:hypothetical protein